MKRFYYYLEREMYYYSYHVVIRTVTGNTTYGKNPHMEANVTYHFLGLIIATTLYWLCHTSYFKRLLADWLFWLWLTGSAYWLLWLCPRLDCFD